jgi:hypothetical protein
MTSLVDVSQADRDATADIHEAQGYISEWVQAIRDGRHDNMRLAQAFARHRLTAEQANAAEIERLREGLTSAIRAAELALFVIRKQGVMPNSSWQRGFEQDLQHAQAALNKKDAPHDEGKPS